MPVYDAEFTGPLRQNILTALKARLNQQVNAIDATLPDVVDWQTPTEIATRFPCLFVAPVSSKLRQAADDSYLMGEHVILIECATDGTDPDVLAYQITQYVTAIDRVIREMSFDDLVGAISTVMGAPAWEVTDHNYQLRKRDTQLRADAQLLITIELMER